ncbi:rhodanese-like domain-containing protein [Pseudomonas sp. TTU2014-080ASC]|uniref:rhodanese-like domain-containing protein n=1 Tax=Pseudomonas sp. TTU2014-080ASC TaxID=1729724 RepID=UPI0007183DFA|nr:rhodanese-like domain-containing protein [Pseudomonas sp. TTU2014-080ASC]KRW59925.1 sulfurtransferase [Pseudomonas sp. TTU2014-080ASC]
MRSLAAAALLFSTTLFAGEAEITAAVDALQSPETVLIDVRTEAEFAEGALDGAENISYEHIAEQITTLAPDKDTTIVLYCRSGRRSGIALDSLRALGYTHVINAGGYKELKDALELQD